ncbi:putative bactericidal permeability-increasing protein [Golovinomyces cichoracearum]|uniref:Putative bactericidal permeability-increasing protein n=1 Tax=Golovinomyces cichoracearum TaxID=62708 RepID=A0A420HRU4_9PEZI|nr:putative bactericidal permeability-increasing protein [Golovinomyces cichoracearum]
MSCCGGQNDCSIDEREPLLAQYEDETSLQRAAHQKMHSYQMIRALLKGYLPSTEQIVINLKTLLASDFLNPDTTEMSSSVSESVKTVGKLLMTNSDFRTFLHDLNIIGRQIFAETSHVLSQTTEDVANTIEQNTEAVEDSSHLDSTKESDDSNHDIDIGAGKISAVIANGVKESGLGFQESVRQNFSGDQKKVLIYRLRNTVTNLRQRSDYSESVNMISVLIKRCVQIYSRGVDQTINTIQNDVNSNKSLEIAIKNVWSLLNSFGDKKAWIELQNRFNNLMEHSNKDPDFELFCVKVSERIKQIFTDPNFFDTKTEIFDILNFKDHDTVTNKSLKEDMNDFMAQIHTTFESMMNDPEVSQLLEVTHRIIYTIFLNENFVNPQLLTDMYTKFIPHFVQAIQYIPIPRLEIAVPEMDILIENLILEPGHTVNQSSFFPFRFNAQFFNDITLHKTRFGSVSTATSIITIKLKGLSFQANEVGFWLRVHKALLRFTDEGIASIEMDKRGIDLELDIEVGKDHLEKILTLRDVRVKIHHLTYSLRKSRFSCLAWLVKPFLRPILRTVFEHKLASTIRDLFHAINRELLFARERLRATRISNPQDLRVFVEAVVTRLKSRDEQDTYANIGIRGGASDRTNIFAGKYAPGSVVKLWDEEAMQAGRIVDKNVIDQGWRNSIFDVQVQG